ncbi:hypothetical protein RFI_39881 [Reticulomyxa filosa]|uniref:Uncharacterized protein n=1 Tax=Reticulomyxa filosa TaxID=46433 RepID=X6L8A6_RETFI|nr:hypothetical protein RFI_39881 [Reticulomyxa filosa]|eukprot:ETN97648.1 hypothetical protein RFI_39881 [Reticulomyxa filosa]
MSLVVGHEGHCIYLGLCKILDSVLVRVDNRWMDTVPLNTPHPKNDVLVQPYLVAYFQLNSLNIEKNKEWLKEHIRNATILKDSDSNESMNHLLAISSIQTDAENCYLRSHNLSHVELMKVLSKQLNVEFDEVYNRMVVKQALVAKAKIYAIQNGVFCRRDESTNQAYFQLYLNSTERVQFHQFYQSNFPKFVQSIKEIDHEWAQYYFDADMFYFQVIPSLSSLS